MSQFIPAIPRVNLSRKAPLNGGLLRAKGRYFFELLGSDGKVKETRVVDNLVTNVGLNWHREFGFDSVTPTAIARMGWIEIGTGTTAAAVTDVALQTALVREAVDTYTPGGTGVVTVANTYAAGVGTGAITEAGLFNAAAAGTMWNRVVFAAINKAAGDTLKVTVTITFTG